MRRERRREAGVPNDILSDLRGVGGRPSVHSLEREKREHNEEVIFYSPGKKITDANALRVFFLS